MADAKLEVLTIGHSSLSYERFLELLRQASITAIADVRTAPYSRHYPHFSRDALQQQLRQDGIAYVFLGQELGGRPNDNHFFCDGIADYEKMAETEQFSRGLERVKEGANKYRIALMCSEHDPLDCHRCLLVGRALFQRGVSVRHILSQGRVVDQRQIEARLMDMAGKSEVDLFDPPAKRLAAAYRERAKRVAYSEPQDKIQRSAAVG